MKPLKIAVIVKYFPIISETFIVNQVNSLIEAGHEVSLYSYNKNVLSDLHRSIQKHDLTSKVVYFKRPPISKIRRLFVFKLWVLKHFLKIDWKLLFRTFNLFKYGKEAYTLKLFFESQWFLLDNDFDVIHVHFGQNSKRIAYLKALGFLSKKTKLVSTFHGHDLLPNKAEFYKNEYQGLLEHSDAITVNSQYLKDLLLEINPNLKHVYILPVGLDTNFFKRDIRKTDHTFFDIVFCGRLIPLKGPDIAIDCVKHLHKLGYNQVRLHIIGDGKLKLALEHNIKKYGLEDFVYMYGSLTQEAVKERFEQADVFLLPGRSDPQTGRAETQGLVIQEAQAMELPVIVSDVGGMKYGLIDGKTGFVVKENDILALVEIIEQLILNSNLRIQMGKKGRLFVEKNYDNNVLAKILLSIYSFLYS
ncbi:MAG TPA: glycosyltransferase family 4 protein [Flavobacteriaceae bacterium]